jgi:hypothetical protein
MRLLVTDHAVHAPRQATAWLITTFGKKKMKVCELQVVLENNRISEAAYSSHGGLNSSNLKCDTNRINGRRSRWAASEDRSEKLAAAGALLAT